ncbi:MAG: hypothetical protein K9L78_05415 [Victivallales bacterium]|nr:hypothetical protein [Victivallales bacterium]MCF7889540.1 hypothetical protein [Victivallales bacterium]
MLIFRKITDLFYYYDPSLEYLIKAFMITLGCSLGVLFMLYTHKPCSIIMIIVPPYFLMLNFSIKKNKDRLFYSMLFFLLVSFSGFFISYFILYKWIIVVYIFITCYLIFSIPKLSPLASFAIILSVSIMLPAGYKAGIDRIYETVISFIISFTVLFIYEYIAVKFIIRLSLKRVSELISDLFNIYTHEQNNNYRSIKKRLHNKYFFEKKIIFESDKIHTENLFLKHIDMFHYKTSNALFKLDILINENEYFLSRTNKYAKIVSRIFILFRKLSRDIRFLEFYSDEYRNINKKLPETFAVINNLKKRLYTMQEAITTDKLEMNSVKDETLIREWLNKIEQTAVSKKNIFSSKELKIYFGIYCMLTDMDSLKDKLSKNNFLKVMKINI